MLSKGRYIEYMNIAGFSSSFLWHPIWHSAWHLFWHSTWHSFWHISTFYLTYIPTFKLAFWHSFCHSFWHIFWHSIWQSTWHLFWHSIWHMFWHSIWSDIYCDIPSDILSGLLSDMCSGPSVLSLRCGSGPGSAHCIQSWQRRRDEGVAPLFKSRYPDLAGGEKNTKLPTEIVTCLTDALATSILESMPKFSMHRKNAVDGNNIIGLWIACIYSRLAWVNHWDRGMWRVWSFQEFVDMNLLSKLRHTPIFTYIHIRCGTRWSNAHHVYICWYH